MGRIEIRDYASLAELKGVMDYTGDSILKVLDSVDGYLDKNYQEMESCLKILEERMDDAKLALDQAEEEYEDCLDSQFEDEDGNVYPSCSAERNAVSEADRKYREAEKDYHKGKSILEEVKDQMDYYHYHPGILQPGGDTLLRDLSTRHTTDACWKLDEIIDKVEKILSTPIRIEEGSSFKPIDRERPSFYVEDEEKKKKENVADQIRKKQQHEGPWIRFKDPNVAVICQYCGRPLVICRCNRNREKV